jgi:hypothetical protein
MSMPWYQKVLFVTVPIAVLPTGALTVLVYALTHTHQPDPFDARPFDPATWASANDEQRAAMSRDAIRHLPPGLPEDEIEPLLGEGYVDKHNEKYPSGVGPQGAARTYWYGLGGRSGTRYFLWVHVGEDGRVMEAVIGSLRS